MNIRRNTKAFWDTKLFWTAERISFAQTFDFISKWQNRRSRCRRTSDLISSRLDFRPTVPSLLLFHPWVWIKYHLKILWAWKGCGRGCERHTSNCCFQTLPESGAQRWWPSLTFKSWLVPVWYLTSMDVTRATRFCLRPRQCVSKVALKWDEGASL